MGDFHKSPLNLGMQAKTSELAAIPNNSYYCLVLKNIVFILA